jgi:hypothetical protein
MERNLGMKKGERRMNSASDLKRFLSKEQLIHLDF